MRLKIIIPVLLAIGCVGAAAGYEGVPAWKHYQAAQLQHQVEMQQADAQYTQQRSLVLAAGKALEDASKDEEVTAAHTALDKISDRLSNLSDAYVDLKDEMPQSFLDEIASRYSATVTEGDKQVQIIHRHTGQLWADYSDKWDALNAAFPKKVDADKELDAQVSTLNGGDAVTDTVRDIVDPIIDDATEAAKSATPDGQEVSADALAAAQLKAVVAKLDAACGCADQNDNDDATGHDDAQDKD